MLILSKFVNTVMRKKIKKQMQTITYFTYLNYDLCFFVFMFKERIKSVRCYYSYGWFLRRNHNWL